MKRMFLAVLCISIVLFSGGLYAGRSSDSITKYKKQILAITVKPKLQKVDTKLLIIHPLIKDRKSRSVITSRIIWSGNHPKIKILSVKRISGRTMGIKRGARGAHRYYYPSKRLVDLLTKGTISNWHFSSSIKLKKRLFSGYKFEAKISGVVRKGAVCLKGGKLYCVNLDFAKGGISHARNMSDRADIWYFYPCFTGLAACSDFYCSDT